MKRITARVRHGRREYYINLLRACRGSSCELFDIA